MPVRNAVLVLVTLSLVAPAARAQNNDTLVPIAPCRVLNTALDAGEESSRRVDVRATRCGRAIPPFATAVSVRVTTVGREAPEKLPAGSGPVREASRRAAIADDASLTFPIPANRHVAVDIDGYYVPAGMPVRAAAESLRAPATPGTNIVHSGSHGDLHLDGATPGHPDAGVGMVAAAAKPWIVAKTGTATAASGLQVVNANNELVLTARGDGRIKLPSNRPTSFFDGVTDFFGEPGTNSSVAIPLNKVHDVTLVNPKDSAGGSTSPLVFYNAETSDEYQSPATTKFRAFTLGFYGLDNVNYDSVIHYHRSNQYHYRARSQNESKDTFWVRAATDGDTITQTRADMYVSGNVGIGVAAPQHKLHVNGSIHATQVIGATYQDLAEWVPATEELEPGTVVILDAGASNTVRASMSAYDTAVAGVVSAQPGLILGEAGAAKEMIATTGRVRVKVDATAAPVKIGDLLVTSDKPGRAMKSVPVSLGGIPIHRPGTIIGKALESLEGGEGEILVLLSMQ